MTRETASDSTGAFIPLDLLRLPKRADLSAGALRRLDRAEDLFGAFGPRDLLALKHWLSATPNTAPGRPDAEVFGLEHRLAPHFRWSASLLARRHGQSLREIDILFGAAAPPVLQDAGTVADLEAQLLALSSRAGGADQFRRSALGTHPDDGGMSRRYPSVVEARSRVATLLDYVQGTEPPAFRALVAMVALLNAHPLADGNGRTARLLYNWILHRGTGGQCYVPIYELTWRTRGSFVICVRQAEMFGEWDPLVRFLTDALEHLATACRIGAAGPCAAAQPSRGPSGSGSPER